MSNISMQTFKCKNCGSPLEIPRNSKGKVVCPACHTEAIFEGLVKNAEIQAKENINSGIPLTAEVPTLHQCVLDAMTSSAVVPLDILEASEIVREEHLCVPAFLFACNATANFNYEAGNVREHKTQVNTGNSIRTEREKYIEWTQMSSAVSMTGSYIVSGNREMKNLITKLFSTYTVNDLIDVEELDFPYDVVAYNFNLPQSTAFNDAVRPVVEKALSNKAEQSLSGKTYRQLTMGGSNIQKDEILRVFLGVYHVVYIYNGKEYSLYLSSDGKKFIYDKAPEDPARRSKWDELVQKRKELQEKRDAAVGKSGRLIPIIVLLVVGLLGIATVFLPIICWILAALLIARKVMKGKAKTAAQAELDACQKEVDAFAAEVKQMKEAFIQREQPIRGIYADYVE